MCHITSPGMTSRCAGLLISALLLVIVAVATRPALADTGSTRTGDPAPDEISHVGERVYSLRQRPPRALSSPGCNLPKLKPVIHLQDE